MEKTPAGPRSPSLFQVVRWTRHPIELLEQCRSRYGDTFTLRFLGFDPLVLFSDPAAIEQIFTGDPEDLRAGEANVVLEPVLGQHSVLLVDGARHKRQRRLLMPAFHGERMQLYGDVMRTITDDVIDRWPTSRPFPVHQEMQRITLEVILRAVFGLDEGPTKEELRDGLLQGADVIVRHPFLLLNWMQRDLGPLTAWREVLRLRAEVDRMLFAELARRRAAGTEGRVDVLALLLEARDEDGLPMSDRELRDELVTMLLAGHETTATTLAWVLRYVSERRDVLERMRAEVAAVFPDGVVEPRRIGELVYLDATIKETQRLMPIIPFVGRKLRVPMRIGGHDLPAGVVAAPCIYLTHRRPDVWEDPEAFRPERFLGTRPSPYAFFPFGGGTRHCLGAAFASYEMKIVLARVVARVELRAAPGYQLRIERRGIAFAPSEGMPLVVERRAA
jgi:cytochrome P450